MAFTGIRDFITINPFISFPGLFVPKKFNEMEELIRGIWLLYLCISSKHRINSKRFAILCKKTKKEYFKIFKNPEDRRSWKLVIPTAHQIWDHPELMDELPAASGLLTEHGSEGNNKFIKMTYQYLTRKCSRQKKMEDFFCRLLKKSDMRFGGPWEFSIANRGLSILLMDFFLSFISL